jgi:eukaryotic-like serine/threonine-protein kinase
MSASESVGPDLDPALERLMSQMDDALFEGRSTDDVEREIAEQFGESPSHIVATLKALHSVRADSRSQSDARSRVFDAPTGQTQSTAEGTTWVRATSGLAKTVFDRFEILERLGSGGAGTVFRARDSRLGRVIALKVARAEALFSSEAKQRFVREAQTLAALRHPNIIPIYEFGESAGLPYIVEELCEGPNLALWLQQRAARCEETPIRLAVEWTLLLAEAVAHAHRHGIVHRDLKPSNVLLGVPAAPRVRSLAEDDAAEGLVPRVSDFGIAKLFESEESVTASQAVLGTAAYMAPEQAEGRSREVGPPADVYSLGVILYELLTGRRPIEGRSDVDTLRRVLTDEPLPLTQVRRNVPLDLEAICMQCLDKNFSARYPSAAELADDLIRFLQGEPVAARRLGPTARFVRRLQRQKLSTAAVLLGTFIATLILAGGGAGLWWAFGALGNQQAQHQNVADRKTYPEDLQRVDVLLRRSDPDITVRQQMAQEAQQILAKYIPLGGAEDLRGFAWHYLWKITHSQTRVGRFPLVRTVAAHAGPVYEVSFSPDGRSLAAASEDKTASVWDVATGQLRFKLLGHTNEVNSVAYSPDGKTLATGSEDGTVRLWDAETGAFQKTVWNHAVEISSVAFNPVNGQLACAAHDGKLTVWDCATLHQVTEKAFGNKLNGVIFSADGKQMAVSGSDENRVRIFEAQGAFNVIAEIEVPDCNGISFSHDGHLLAVSHFSGARVYRIRTRELLAQVHLAGFHIRCVLFSPDDSGLLIAGDSPAFVDLTTGEMWDPFNEQDPAAPRPQAPTMWVAGLSPNNKVVATGDTNGQVTFWECTLRRNLHRTRLPIPAGAPAASLALSADGLRLAVTTDAAPGKETKSEVAVWDIASAQPKRLLQLTPNEARGAALTPHAESLAYAERQSAQEPWKIRIVDAETGALQREIAGEITGLDYLVFGSKGSLLISQERYPHPPEARLRFREVSTGKAVRTVFVPSPLAPYAVSSSDTLFATSGTNKNSCIDLFSSLPEPIVNLCGFGESIRAVAFTHDEKLVIARSGGGHIGVLGRGKEGLIRQFTVPGVSSVSGYGMAVSPDGRALALASKEGIVLADFESGQALCTLPFPGELEEVKTVAFAGDGRTIAATGVAGSGHCGVYLWQIDESPAVSTPTGDAGSQ